MYITSLKAQVQLSWTYHFLLSHPPICSPPTLPLSIRRGNSPRDIASHRPIRILPPQFDESARIPSSRAFAIHFPHPHLLLLSPNPRCTPHRWAKSRHRRASRPPPKIQQRRYCTPLQAIPLHAVSLERLRPHVCAYYTIRLISRASWSPALLALPSVALTPHALSDVEKVLLL